MPIVGTRAPIRPAAHPPQAPVPCGRSVTAFDELTGAVGRTVIGDDHVESRVALAFQRGEEQSQVIPPVINGNDRADHVSPPSPRSCHARRVDNVASPGARIGNQWMGKPRNMPGKRDDLVTYLDKPVFACPVCGNPLARHDRTFQCMEGHTFDIAREGFVNLLLPQRRRSKNPGYSKEMIAGRRDFFDAGHYQLLADRVADVILSCLPGQAEQVVLDAGCGEGYYLRRLRARMGGQRPGGRPCCAAPTSPSPLSGWLPDAILRVCMQWPVPITCRYCLTELMYSSPTSLR